MDLLVIFSIETMWGCGFHRDHLTLQAASQGRSGASCSCYLLGLDREQLLAFLAQLTSLVLSCLDESCDHLYAPEPCRGANGLCAVSTALTC